MGNPGEPPQRQRRLLHRALPCPASTPAANGAAGTNRRRKETREMKRRRPPSRVMLNPAAVWRLLDELDMSQNELARRCGITPGHLSLLMNGKRGPSPQLRRRFATCPGREQFRRPVRDRTDGGMRRKLRVVKWAETQKRRIHGRPGRPLIRRPPLGVLASRADELLLPFLFGAERPQEHGEGCGLRFPAVSLRTASAFRAAAGPLLPRPL